MIRAQGRRRRGGWRKQGRRLQAYVRLHRGPGGFATRMFALGTKAEVMQQWIDETFIEYRRRHPRAPRGTLAGDVAAYLNVLVNRPALQAERAHHLAWWCERFGHRSRHGLTAIELETALNELHASGAAASTVRHYRTALFHVFTKLDGKSAPNPLKDVPPPAQPEPLPRAIPPEVIDRIFAAMPDRKYARKLTAARARSIRERARRAGANVSLIASHEQISETMVRKLAGHVRQNYDSASKAKARLMVLAYVGIPPAIIMQIEPQHLDLEGASVMVRGRSKGKGTRAVRLPLTPSGVAAFRSFVAAEAFGPFSTSSVRAVFRRAIARMCAALEADPDTARLGATLRESLKDAKPYDLRHSFLTEAQLATGNLRATQGLALHADQRQTHRYTLAAVQPELQAAADALAARQASQPVRNQTRTKRA